GGSILFRACVKGGADEKSAASRPVAYRIPTSLTQASHCQTACCATGDFCAVAGSTVKISAASIWRRSGMWQCSALRAINNYWADDHAGTRRDPHQRERGRGALSAVAKR